MLPLPIPIAIMTQAPAVPIDAQRWDRRVLVIFSPTRDDPAFERQRRLLDADAMADRDLHVVQVIGDTVSGAREYAGRLRQRYSVAANRFEALLIGKDGGVKLRSADAVPMQRLAATIDSMPMRQREMATAKPAP